MNKVFRVVILLNAAVLVFIKSTEAQDSVMIRSHIVKLTNAKAYTLKVAESMPEHLYGFKPVSDEMSFREQLVHIGKNIYWLSSTYIREVDDPMKGMELAKDSLSKEQVLLFLAKAYDYAISSFRELNIESINKEFKWAGGKMNKYQFMNLIQDHQTHHRGQLMVYLRLNGVQPPKYIGW